MLFLIARNFEPGTNTAYKIDFLIAVVFWSTSKLQYLKYFYLTVYHHIHQSFTNIIILVIRYLQKFEREECGWNQIIHQRYACVVEILVDNVHSWFCYYNRLNERNEKCFI